MITFVSAGNILTQNSVCNCAKEDLLTIIKASLSLDTSPPLASMPFFIIFL